MKQTKISIHRKFPAIRYQSPYYSKEVVGAGGGEAGGPSSPPSHGNQRESSTCGIYNAHYNFHKNWVCSATHNYSNPKMGVGKGMAKYTGRGVSLDSTLVLYCLPILTSYINPNSATKKVGHSYLDPTCSSCPYMRNKNKNLAIKMAVRSYLTS